MSTGLNCLFFETADHQWYYLLEDWDSPKGAWDWREHATCYGPFATQMLANDHLRDEHANPGGWSESRYDPKSPPDELLINLAAKAIAPRRDRRSYRY